MKEQPKPAKLEDLSPKQQKALAEFAKRVVSSRVKKGNKGDAAIAEQTMVDGILEQGMARVSEVLRAQSTYERLHDNSNYYSR